MPVSQEVNPACFFFHKHKGVLSPVIANVTVKIKQVNKQKQDKLLWKKASVIKAIILPRRLL